MKPVRISGGILETEFASPWSAPRNRCFDCCPEVEREVEAASRLRALLACALDFVPSDHPIVFEAIKELE